MGDLLLRSPEVIDLTDQTFTFEGVTAWPLSGNILRKPVIAQWKTTKINPLETQWFVINL